MLQVHTVVLLRSFCDQSMNTLPVRLALDMSETTSSSSCSMVIAIARARPLVSLKLIPRLLNGTYTCRPLLPDDLMQHCSFSRLNRSRSFIAILAHSLIPAG